MSTVSRYERHLALAPVVAHGWRMATMTAPAPMFGANGLRVGPYGVLHIAEWLGDRVTTWDPITGAVGTAVTIDDPLDGPDDVAFDAAGTLYVTSFGTGKVHAKGRDGTFRTLMDDAPAANGITIDAEDRLFVTEFRTGGRTLEVDRETPERFRVITDATDHGNALERGPDGLLYIPNVYEGSVSAVDPESGALRHVVGDLGMITAVKFDPRGRLCVCLQFDGVLAIALTTGERELLVDRPYGDMIDNFCFDAHGRVYISISTDGQIERYDPGAPRDPTVIIEGGLLGPFGMSPHPDGLLVSDYLGTYVVGFNGGVELFARALDRGPSIDAVALDAERAIALSRAGDVFGVTRGSDGTHTLIAGDGSHGFSGVERAPGVRSLCADGDGVAVGHAGGLVVRLDAHGQQRGSVQTGLSSVDAVAAGGTTVAAADQQAGVVAIVAEHGTARIDGLGAPTGIAILGDAVAVAEQATGTIALHPLCGGAATVIVSGLPLRRPMLRPRADGRRSPLVPSAATELIVGCAGDGSIRRLTRV